MSKRYLIITALLVSSFLMSAGLLLLGQKHGSQLRTSLVSAQTPVCVERPDGITHWWDGDSVSGTTAQDLIGAVSGNMRGAGIVEGKVGTAFNFAGNDLNPNGSRNSFSGDFIGLPQNFFPFPTSGVSNNAFSFEMWIKVAPGDSGVIFGQQNNTPFNGTSGYVPGLWVTTAGTLGVEVFWGNGRRFESNQTVTDNQWHHVAIVYDGTTETAFLDGANVGSIAMDQFSFASSYQYQIGTGVSSNRANSIGGWHSYRGLLDEISIYNRALSLSEIQGIVSAGEAGKCKVECGNNLVQPENNEVCDGTDLAGQTCATQGQANDSGVLTCASDCRSFDTSGCTAAPPCADGLDNDFDGLIDFPQDSGCDSATDISEEDTPDPLCSDGNDNDLDGLIDFPSDPGCSSPSDGDETDPPLPPSERIISGRRSASISGFPAYQGFAVFVDDTTEPYDENGAALSSGETGFDDTEALPACGDDFDNDGDGFIDFPEDPGCDDSQDLDEVDDADGEEDEDDELRIDVPSQYLTTIQTVDLQTQYLVILPNGQKGRRFAFDFEANERSGNFAYGIVGREPNSNGDFVLQRSGLTLNETGLMTGEPGAVQPGNYRYQFFITDGVDTLEFLVQIAIHDGFGNPVGPIIETDILAEKVCVLGEECKGFFQATLGIAPYTYLISGESPDVSPFLQTNLNEAFFDLDLDPEDDLALAGNYEITIIVTDSADRLDTGEEAEAEVITGNTASLSFTLVIEEPPPEEIVSSFKFSAERTCEFLDLSPSALEHLFAQFTCRNEIMQGSGGLFRATDFLNRAEAAKITTLILTETEQVDTTFRPFSGLPGNTPVNYDDVAVADWFASYVFYLFREGVIIDNTVYRPADILTTAEAMKLIIEAYAGLNVNLLDDLEEITDFGDWFEPYQTVASYVDASIADRNPALPAERGQIAELLYQLDQKYPSSKFK